MIIPKSIIHAINKGSYFLGHVHLSPDPDSIGSMLALKLGLKQLNKHLTVYSENRILDKYLFLPKIDKILNANIVDLPKKISHFDYYLSIDTPKWSMATRFSNFHPEIPLINIDHHPGNSIVSKLKMIDTDASSSGELIYQLLHKLKVEITPEIATSLLFAILGDTNTFSNLNTKEQSLTTAGKLIKAGGDYSACIKSINKSYSLQDIKILSKLMSSVHIHPQYKFAWFVLSSSEWQSVGQGVTTSVGELANLVATKLGGLDFGLVLIEKTKGLTGGILRSYSKDIDVSLVAQTLGGGGHHAAASFKVEMDLESAQKEVLNNIKQLYDLGRL